MDFFHLFWEQIVFIAKLVYLSVNLAEFFFTRPIRIKSRKIFAHNFIVSNKLTFVRIEFFSAFSDLGDSLFVCLPLELLLLFCVGLFLVTIYLSFEIFIWVINIISSMSIISLSFKIVTVLFFATKSFVFFFYLEFWFVKNLLHRHTSDHHYSIVHKPIFRSNHDYFRTFRIYWDFAQ